MREFTAFEVDGIRYQMLPLPVQKSTVVLTRLAKIVFDPLGKAVSAIDMDNSGSSSLLDKNIDMSLVGKAIAAFGDRLEEAVVWNTIVELLSTVEKGNDQGGFSKINIEVDFLGQIGHLLKVVTKSINVNYHDFLVPILGGLEKAKHLMPFKTQSTGSSGDQSSKK